MTQKQTRANQHAAMRRKWRLDGTYERLLDIQGGCGICFKTVFETGRLDIDHDHVSDQPRGLLCRGCNMRLGRERNPAWLHAAADYLERTA